MIDETILALPAEAALDQLRRVIDADPSLPASWYARWWASDAELLRGNLQGAIAAYPPPSSSRASLQVDRLLSLKVAAEEPPTAQDILALLGPKVTAVGAEHLEEIRCAAEAIHSLTPRDERVAQLCTWASLAPACSYPVYIGSSYGYRASQQVELRMFSFSEVDECRAAARELARAAENKVRQTLGVPRVGEGWVSETRLFRQIQDALPHLTVVQHYSPDWLGRQHLDVAIPALNVALEYQGAQHDRPVEFFGGETAWQQSQRRDAQKRRLCRRHGMHLIEVRPGYELGVVLGQIASAPGALLDPGSTPGPETHPRG